MKSFKSLLALSAALLSATVSSATTLSSVIHMDNGFVAYVSSSDSTTGTAFSSGNNWPIGFTGSTNLLAGQDYYLHVYGYDQGGIGGFLGQFGLSGSDHVFANGGTTLLTNTTDWKGNLLGFNGTYGAVSFLGNNGAYPWDYQGDVSGSANWIWVGDGHNNNSVYFSTKISAVATPDAASSAALILFGLVGLVALHRSRRVA